MRQTFRTALVLVAVTLAFQTTASCQQDVPESAKKIMNIFQGAEDWPEYGPGEISSRPGKFKPVRSVFARNTHLTSDSPMSVRAVWEVDQVAWEGRPVTMISWFSAGPVAPRSSVGYVDPETGALLSLPHGPGPHPGIVWVHGSGRTPRNEAMFFPQYLADLGFALLAFDKRGVGASEGNYAMPDGSTFNVPFLRRRAEDVVAAMTALRRHPRIAGEQVGLFGISQAGWVLPVAASSTECAFTISMSGGATRLSQEEHFSRLTDEQRSDDSLPTIEDALTKVRTRTPRDHDWSTDFASQRCPGLWLYGMKDRSNPSQLCVEVLEAVKSEHDKDFSIVQFPDGNHPLMQSRVGGRAERLVLSRFVPGMFTTIEAWLEKRGFMP